MAGAVVGSNAFGLDSDLYTGTRNNDRGGSLVERHREKMQAELEDIAMQKLAALMPQMGAAVRVAALQETEWSVDMAVTLLRKFHTESEELLRGLYKASIWVTEVCALQLPRACIPLCSQGALLLPMHACDLVASTH
jgi:hypothetical protein